MIFLTLLCFCFFSGSWNTLALPTDLRPPEILPKNYLQSIFIHEDRFDSRSIYGILWSCLSIIFACTWITVHPNMPAPGDSQWAVLRRRVAIMGYFILAPEFVIVWAARQHFGARYLTKKYAKDHPGWTPVHSFFLIMGGFTLHKGRKPLRVLVAKDLEEAGKIEWPTITKEEIADRSKGDYLSKTIVLFQTTWFVGQCIARGAYGLTVTELEIVTLAFASLTGVIYYLWWDKPLDVRCSIPVHLLDGALRKIEGDIEKEETGSQIILSTISEQEKDENVAVNPNPLPTASIHVDISTPDPASTRMQRFRAFRRDACKKYGTLFGLGYVFIAFPLNRFLDAFVAMPDCTILGDNTLRVPTFYSPCNDDKHRQVIPTALAACVATIFGAIHCIAWSFPFATSQERLVWRISAVLVSGLPIPTVLYSFPLKGFVAEQNKTTWQKLYVYSHSILIWVFIIPLYLIARIALLVLSLMALRALPPGAYVELNWVSFLPHI
jgi:hypothetical protein